MRNRKRRSAWQEGNRFTLLPGSRRYLPAIGSAIDRARESILLELYLMESGRLADRLIAALERAARRGVAVRVLLDGFGAMRLAEADRQRLRTAGVALRFFNPLAWRALGQNLTRDHRKLLVVDERLAFTGGFGAADEFLEAWFEIAVRIEGPVVDDWSELFLSLWNSSLTRGKPEDIPARQPPAPRRTGRRCTPVEQGGMLGRVVWGQGYRYQTIRLSLHQQIAQAHHRIWFCTPYFVPTLSLRRRLARAAQRGIDVRLLLPGDTHDHPGVRYAGQRFYGRLLRAGVRIFEFQPAFIHAKFSLADDWTSVGSCNFDHWSLQWNLEANQEVLDTGFADQVALLFESCFARSHEILLEQWEQRSWWQRLREGAYGTLDAWVTRLR
ncbi:Phosphatidylserine/phosphatidylglycerophosphate/cardiolipin synthase [Modicisalibacter ilicicola DSM 19980]|uniref:Phosphatidylserine/phosphatidylglycerophosphate/cardiolipin synthase n=1 Tax=Modicisalibacter ilicicola DSM 19980 TaxID=1121942 RepID=A0A1M4UM74_9GAMM|nr:phosphatidylserine/phosphatidylglycerophosphate/cardiolipin synthase family protein [Halomonas ilicicola]SHE57829.1 Phosphatidylserine/phosphatidylglycerophosphate/cardiolipin synthase [Halomonas ilicicola DSM 19980]